MINLINRIGKCAIPVSVLTMMPLVASASTNLRADDFVGISFWIISIAMVAATIFFFMESNAVGYFAQPFCNIRYRTSSSCPR
jgi:hypothetical protein